MAAITNPMKYQCALFKSSRKHYEHALEAYEEGRNTSGPMTAAIETAENGGDQELAGWLTTLKPTLESGAPNISTARLIALRYNEYNKICAWGLSDFDPNDPLKVPGSGGIA
ncbi:MAG: hypothetical protein AB1665_03660 [Candidatus Thermoplasmatota archaeon]